VDSNTVAELRNVSKNYRLGKVSISAVRNVSIEIGSSDFLVIAGPSGSGKTTLLNIIGLIDKPSGGEVWFAGENVTAKPLNNLHRQRRKSLGYIFQSFNLIPVLSVYENVEYPLLLNGTPRALRRELVERTLGTVGLYGRRRHKPNELSGGQRQRVSIARAVVKTPEIVLADEPTANLDSRTGLEIVDLMARLNDDAGMTFVFSTHDPLIIKSGKRIIRLRDGKLVGSEEELSCRS